MSPSSSKFFFRIEILFLILSVLLISPSLSEKCHRSDKNALLKIKKALNDPHELIQWTPDTDCCDWNATIRCDERTHRVTSLSVSQANFNLLPIPINGLVELRYLESLTFFETNLSGPIPETLTKLTNLMFLDLSWNQLTGPVPLFLTQLKNLVYIALSSNNLIGSIPPSFSQIQNLSNLQLDNNHLTGTIPESFGDLKSRSINLFLSHNRLSGKIPESLGNANFRYIDLSRNQLEGDISFMFGRNKTMWSVFLSRNRLEFDFSNFVFPRDLSDLDLNHNRIFGSLPQDIVNVEIFTNFNVSYNRLCGQIPTGIKLLDYTPTAFFHNKCLCGSALPNPCK